MLKLNGGIATALPVNVTKEEDIQNLINTAVNVALFLASDDSSFVNGTIVIADAGWTAY